jgi:hypothetical protein
MAAGSIGSLAQEVLNEVRKDNLMKVAEHQILKTASSRTPATTEIGQLLQKVANRLRSKSDEVTVGDVENFLRELSDAH